MSLGIKFRRNNKAELTDILLAEIVYAIDTNEWGLGTSTGTVWRKHVIDFENILISGVGLPNVSLGEIGYVYIDTTDNSGIYIKGFNGWEFSKHPMSRALIDVNFLPTTVGYNDFSKLFSTDAEQIETSVEYIAINPQDVLNLKQLTEQLGVLKNDGSTQMNAGYIPSNNQEVIIIGNLNEEVNLVPTTNPTVIGEIWNDNGIPKIYGGIV